MVSTLIKALHSGNRFRAQRVPLVAGQTVGGHCRDGPTT
jgi:hypothetical protein